MKSLIILWLCFIALPSAQTPNWSSVKETNINFGASLSYDMFTNSFGNHVIIQESNALKYYRMNLNGEAGTPVTLESSAVISPTITGDASRIYIVYRKSNETFIRTKYSTNGGTIWYNLSSNIDACSGEIESVMSNGRLLVVYSLNNQILYSYNLLAGGSWTTTTPVSDTESGSSPRIGVWTEDGIDMVYFYWRTNFREGKTREYNMFYNSWSNIFQCYYLSQSNISNSFPIGFTVGSDWIYYYYSFTTTNPFEVYTQYRILSKSGGYISQSYPELNQTYRINSTTTVDGRSYTSYFTFYNTQDMGPGLYRFKNYGTNYFNPDQFYAHPNLQEVVTPVNLSAAGNDTHILWKDNLGGNNGNNLRYIIDDQPPSVPKNLILTSYNNHPRLTWSKNPDADIRNYNIYKSKGASEFVLHTTATGTVWTDMSESICTAIPPDQCIWETLARYKITAVDLNYFQSAFSNEVEARVIGASDKIVSDDPEERGFTYSLKQNYPNPFNPVTLINYEIKDRGFVSLKIYDILGKEIAELVNGVKESGEYSAEFNAGTLPSGIYIYSLKVNGFIENRKMSLLK